MPEKTTYKNTLFFYFPTKIFYSPPKNPPATKKVCKKERLASTVARLSFYKQKVMFRVCQQRYSLHSFLRYIKMPLVLVQQSILSHPFEA